MYGQGPDYPVTFEFHVEYKDIAFVKLLTGIEVVACGGTYFL